MPNPTETEASAPRSAADAGDRDRPDPVFPGLVDEARVADPDVLRHIFVRDQMQEWSRDPIIMARASGSHYFDLSGKRYLDGISGIYVVSVGHGNPRVIEAARAAMERLAFSPAMHGTNPDAIRLAKLLADLAPGDLSAVKLQTGGSEVTEAAIKMARQYHKLTGNPGKYKIITRYQSWHGSTTGSLAASGLKSRKTVNEPLPAGFLHVFPPHCYRCPFGKRYPDCGITCASIVGDVIEMEDPATVAAVMVEPIGHTGGVLEPPEEYLPKLREVCDRHGVLLIFDEIITGIGRTGRLFAAETFGVLPDLLCVAKGLGGGVAPVSALICRDHVARAFWGPAATNPGFVEGHTFEGNPVASAVGIAVLREILDRGLLANARARGEQLRLGLERLAERRGVVGDIRGRGLFQGIELVADRATRARFAPGSEIGVRIGRAALERGLLCRYDPHWMAFGPPLTVSAEEIDELLGVLDAAFEAVLGPGTTPA